MALDALAIMDGHSMGGLIAQEVALRAPAMAKYDASGRLGQLANIPSMVMSAELDRIALPSFGRELAAAIPSARFVELPGAGHGVPIHDSEVVNARLAEHFAAAE